jgi:hypothetical protein
VGLKEEDNTPLTLTEKFTVETHFIIRLHQLAGKLRADITAYR